MNICKKCHKIYTYRQYQWCKFCQIKDIKDEIFTSGNEKIDNLIQEKQLEIDNPFDIIFKWIPYDQLLDINEVDNDDFSTIFSAKWKHGPLFWDKYNEKYLRLLNSKVLLKYLSNKQNIDEFLNEVCNFSVKSNYCFKIQK
jgi:hypothetical protein